MQCGSEEARHKEGGNKMPVRILKGKQRGSKY